MWKPTTTMMVLLGDSCVHVFVGRVFCVQIVIVSSSPSLCSTMWRYVYPRVLPLENAVIQGLSQCIYSRYIAMHSIEAWLPLESRFSPLHFMIGEGRSAHPSSGRLQPCRIYGSATAMSWTAQAFLPPPPPPAYEQNHC